MSNELLPAESIAFTIAKAQVERGDAVTPNVAAVVVMAVDRLVNGCRYETFVEGDPEHGFAVYGWQCFSCGQSGRGFKTAEDAQAGADAFHESGIAVASARERDAEKGEG